MEGSLEGIMNQIIEIGIFVFTIILLLISVGYLIHEYRYGVLSYMNGTYYLIGGPLNIWDRMQGIRNVFGQLPLKNYVWTIAIFFSLFCLYQLSLSLDQIKFPKYPTWLFGVDSVEDAYKGLPSGLTSIKHPLFMLIGKGLYDLGSLIYSWFSGPYINNLTLTYPVAFLGGVNISLSFWIFMRNYRSWETSVLFAGLYGISTAIWAFSSFPETKVLTAILVNLFLLALLRLPQEPKRLYWIAILNAIACYGSPHAILFGIIPISFILVKYGWSVQTTRQIFVYGAILYLLFLFPYEFYTKYLGHDLALPAGYINANGSFYNFLELRWYLLHSLNFFLFSIVGPNIHPSLYTGQPIGYFGPLITPSLAGLLQISLLWVFVACLFILFVARCLSVLAQSMAKAGKLSLALLVFVICYMLFFVYIYPHESFLFTMPTVMPLLLVVHSGYAPLVRTKWRALLFILVPGIFVNNLTFIISTYSYR